MADSELRVFVEIPKGSRNKYEWHAESATIELDRRLFAAVSYPTDYGFVPQTTGPDGEELDALICVTEPTFPGCTIAVKPIAVLRMRSEQGGDEELRIVCVPSRDPAWNDIEEVDELPGQLKDEIAHFFEVYTDLEGGSSQVEGWGSSDDARRAVERAQREYRERERG